MFCGELYIDSENSALLRARFEIHPRYVKAATRLFVIRQAPKIRLTTEKLSIPSHTNPGTVPIMSTTSVATFTSR